MTSTTHFDLFKINGFKITNVEHGGIDNPACVDICIHLFTKGDKCIEFTESIIADGYSRAQFQEQIDSAYAQITDEENAEEISEIGFDDAYTSLIEVLLRNYLDDAIGNGALFYDPHCSEVLIEDATNLQLVLDISFVDIQFKNNEVISAYVEIILDDDTIKIIRDDEIPVKINDIRWDAEELEDKSPEQIDAADEVLGTVIQEEVHCALMALIEKKQLFINTYSNMCVVID